MQIIKKQLSDVIDELDFDAGSLQQIEARLEVIHSITRKYGGSVDDVLDYYENITKEYNLLTGNDESSDDMEKDLKRLEKELIVAAENLSQERHQLAKNLEAEIKQELALARENSIVMEMKLLNFIFQLTLVKVSNLWLK